MVKQGSLSTLEDCGQTGPGLITLESVYSRVDTGPILAIIYYILYVSALVL